ncbi:MAG: hypothetical protein QOJ02_3426 [Acidobacteriota bacterium]|nr:hypothetical protein [Acidobacteriota bacterium]
MKRAQEKIKDLVEAQALAELQNYADNPARALASYFFTDATSDLFARWLDALAELSHNQGTARALAGLRGVGKSHMLAAFGALAAFPELRSSIEDTHVSTSARRLLSYRYKVAHVERGTRPTLHEELSAALGGDLETWKTEPSKMLSFAASMSDTPLVLIVDTAFEREARVERDDGALLSELASTAKLQNIFIALALDDDIAGADGANVSLSGEFQIDYLDPEHLYRITDVHLFQKNDQSRAALREMHTTLRTLVPGFNWSEPRFSAIYPMHPLIAEVSSAVRQYVPTFAFLPFASAAGAHAVNRPALSLVVLDEVFDRTEKEMRRAEKLKDAINAYDHLAKHAVAQIPIMQRLQAKLLLKGLFILSLDGRGATARELGAAMLLYDEQQPAAAIERIANMLAIFFEAAPHGSLLRDVDKDDARYRFSIDVPESLSNASAVAAPAPEVAEETADPASVPAHAVTLSDEELAQWASLLTEHALPGSLAEPDARDHVRAALAEWQKAWRAESLLKDLDLLPDEGLTTRIWNLAAAVRKSFGHATDAIEATLSKTISLEEGLERVAVAFNNSPEQLVRNREQLAQLKSFVRELPQRERVRAYLSLAESTGVDEIESARRELLAIAEDVQNLLDAESVERFNRLWNEFHARYSEYYVKLHDEALRDGARGQAIEEQTQTDAWHEFESLSQLQIVNRRYWEEAGAMLELARASECELPARQMLEEHTICACRFRLTMASALARLPQDLAELIERGLAAHRRTLLFLSTPLAIALDALARKGGDDETANRARSLSGAFAQGTGPEHFSPMDVHLIESALERMTTPPPVRLRLPVSDYGLLTRDELRARLNQWLDDLPSEPALVEVVERDGTDGG